MASATHIEKDLPRTFHPDLNSLDPVVLDMEWARYVVAAAKQEGSALAGLVAVLSIRARTEAIATVAQFEYNTAVILHLRLPTLINMIT